MAPVDDGAPRSPNGGTTPRPDPTTLTTDALRREIEQLRELLETKLSTLDAKMTGHFFIDEQRFAAIDERFHTVETLRVEQKRDNGTVQQKLGATDNRTATYAMAGFIGLLISIVIGIVSFALANLS